jgi:hypothetical protein
MFPSPFGKETQTMHRSPPPIPATGWLPACFSLAMVCALLRALPRPDARQPAWLGRQALFDALEMVRLLRPRDAIEASLVLQMVIALLRSPLSFALAAAHEHDPKLMLRYQRHAMAESRLAERLDLSLRRYRRERAAEGLAAPADAPWEYSLVELEAIWRAADVTDDAPQQGPEEPPAAPATAEGADAAPDAATAAPQPLSRQQRRALERLGRRIAAKLAAPARQLAHAA